MQKFSHNIALTAGLIVLTCGLWWDWSAWLTVKRVVLSYLAFFGASGGLFLAFRATRILEPDPGRTGNRRAAREGRNGS